MKIKVNLFLFYLDSEGDSDIGRLKESGLIDESKDSFLPVAREIFFEFLNVVRADEIGRILEELERTVVEYPRVAVKVIIELHKFTRELEHLRQSLNGCIIENILTKYKDSHSVDRKSVLFDYFWILIQKNLIEGTTTGLNLKLARI